MTVKEQREILEAYERGEEIEWRKKNSDMNFVILNDKNHDFNFEHFEYRIKKNRWRAMKNGKYYFVGTFWDVYEGLDSYCCCDQIRFKSGNYFRTREDAEKARRLLEETLTKFHEENE